MRISAPWPGSHPAPVTSHGPVSAAVSAGIAAPAPSPGSASVAAAGGIGWVLRLTSVSTPSRPRLPAISFTRS